MPAAAQQAARYSRFTKRDIAVTKRNMPPRRLSQNAHFTMMYITLYVIGDEFPANEPEI